MPSNVSFLVTLEFKKGIIVIHMILIDMLCMMIYFLSLSLTIHLLIILNVSMVLPIPQVLPAPTFEGSISTSTSLVAVPSQLTYHHRPRPTLVLDD